ncbi:hypothetical protein TBLA_0B04890 [Henningerozyma blattae CBS 6284]|uniref:HDA1 complex subunit 3 n=1 Tax=Henningerozyma blattae (strain ATCC 34711 / CBS 6284 / DSM 70876 / NBRC 10599 / NRRL Y-10934 / UCD 77-7) TaxID=1071380 RepID=I2GYX1_HENB6|nr:hypothetical protein TBLA_0B04890 [Tetrapisispora blattae CBS 6284]CCH59323.1 hypothetical protein TBLA_0B04890 [Tetrapisispora blattae CBS 6284]
MNLLKILDTKPIPAIVDARTLGVSGNTSGDYWLPTPMCLYQKELTDQVISLHYSDILRYFETSHFQEDVVLESLRTMCYNSELVATHPYLLIDHYMPKSLTGKDIPNHLSEFSGKFTVLKDLIAILQEYEADTAIVCRPGRTMDLVEALLMGLKVNIKRYDGNTVKSKQYKAKQKTFSCTCHIFPSTDYDSKKIPIEASLQFNCVITLDPSVDTNTKAFRKIRNYGKDTTTQDGSDNSPIIRLTTINSIDHCKLFFKNKNSNGSTSNSNTNKDKDKLGDEDLKTLENITAGIVVLRGRVGILPPDLRPIYSQKLSYLIPWIENTQLPWPLPDIYPIKEYNSVDVEISLLTEVHYKQVEDELEAAFGRKTRGRNNNSNNTGSTKNGKLEDTVLPFYMLKRLKNDYSTNPTKQDMTQLTGITTANSKMGNMYHLSSGILTHKLVQEIGQIYVELDLQNKEINGYIQTNLIEEDHVQNFQEEYKKMNTKVEQALLTDSNNKQRSQEIFNENKQKLTEIEKLKETFEKMKELLKNKNNDLFESYSKQLSLQDDIRHKESQLNSNRTEKEYMEKEFNRAEASKNDSEIEIEKLTNEINEYANIIKTKLENVTKNGSGLHESINKLNDRREQQISSFKVSEINLGNVVHDLHKIPTPRIRTSAQVTKKGRRKRG